MKNEKLTPIKTIAGKILLYFYLLQRKNITDLNLAMLNFSFKRSPNNQVDGMEMPGREKTILKDEKFEGYSDVDIFNALMYLSDSYLIDYKESKSTAGSHLHQLKITASGINIIEGIERGEEEKREFNVTFNFNVQNNVTLESLLKAEFGSIFKASLL